MLSVRERSFLILFGVVLVVAFLPSKALGQMIALIFLFGWTFFVSPAPIQVFTRLLIVAGIYILGAAPYFLLVPEFSPFNYLLFAVTASSLTVLVCDLSVVATEPVLSRLGRMARAFLLVQGVVGLAQALYGFSLVGFFDLSTGDIVGGTLNPWFIYTGRSENVVFGILMSTLLFLSYGTSSKATPRLLPTIAMGLGSLVFLLAAVLHLVVFAICALVCAVAMSFMARRQSTSAGGADGTRMSFRAIVFIVALVPSILLLLNYLMPRNLSFATDAVEQLFDVHEYSQHAKPRTIYYTLVDLPAAVPVQPLIGVGPGQFTSRAALIASGEYLEGFELPFGPFASSHTDYILELYRAFRLAKTGGSTWFPFSSWLTLYGEMGIMGIALFGWLCLKALRTHLRSVSPFFPRLRILAIALLFYVVLIGFQDNYWEFTQAIFPAVLVLHLWYHHVQRCRREGVAAVEPEASRPSDEPGARPPGVVESTT